MKKRAMHWIRRAGIPMARTAGSSRNMRTIGGRAGYSDKGGNAHYYEAAFLR